jgi:1-acyl-sn-glycerol-3-phosphate acyltransferase
MIVSNHQNGVCDPLGILLSGHPRKERKPKCLVRADVFTVPVLKSIVRWLGLLPAYRISHDGAESLANNAGTFRETEDELLKDGTVILFPEAKHQDKRWLGKFSLAYLHILFKAAEKTGFEKELFVLPSCNHYSDYFGLGEEMLVSFGTPVSIAPYYRLYKTKPRTAQRQVNELVRQQISEMMLNITDLNNYAAIDYLRNTYGVRYAKENGFNPDYLPDKLLADKQLFHRLEAAKAADETRIGQIYEQVHALKEKTEQLGINDRHMDAKCSIWQITGEGVAGIVLFPVLLISLIPNLLILFVPQAIAAKIKDPMMRSTIYLSANILFIFPLSYFLVFEFSRLITKNLPFSLLYAFGIPFFGIFVLNYHKRWKCWKSRRQVYRLRKNRKKDDLISLRSRIFESLDQILKQMN